MKKLKIYCVLALAWLIVGSCRPDQNIFGKCKNVDSFQYCEIKFSIVTPDREDYFAKNPDLNWQNFMVYDENWDYAKSNGNSWELKKQGYFISNELYLDYASIWDAYGKDEVKTFYFKYNQDIDTMRVEYKIKNECTHREYIRVYYNQELLVDQKTNLTDGGFGMLIYKK
jgi:hypothetical protein